MDSDTKATEAVEEEVVDTPVPTKPKAKRKVAAPKKARPSNASSVKGGKWERDVGKALSLWVTRGERGDIFRRAITSGGRFTSHTQKGKDGGHPGDIGISHPLGAGFVAQFCIEAKHHKDVNLGAYILGVGNPFLSKVVEKVKGEAQSAGLDWIAVIKQDKRPPFMLMSEETGAIARRCSTVPFRYHTLFDNAPVILVRMDAFIESVNPYTFIKAMGAEMPIDGKKHQAPKAIQRRPLSQPPPARIERRPLRIERRPLRT